MTPPDAGPRTATGAFPIIALATVALSMLPSALTAQGTVTVRAGSAAQVSVLPGARLAIPIVIDMAAAGGLTLGALTTTVAWNSAVVTLDSVKAAGFGTLTTNLTNAATGVATLDVSAVTGTTATVTMATLFFTAANTTGGTSLSLTPTAATIVGGTSILSQIDNQDAGVCAEPSGLFGDGNGDGNVNILDAQQVARFSVGLTVASVPAINALADVNADLNTNIIDAQQIARFSVGLTASVRINTLRVTPHVATNISIVPFATALNLAQLVRLSAIPKDAGNIAQTGCAPVTWSSSDNAVATVSSSGSLRAIAAGTATITATSGSAIASTPIVVGTPTSVWNGSASPSWISAANWTGGVPLATSDALIPAGTPNDPVLPSVMSVRNLTIQPGARVTGFGTVMTISGGVTNLGTLNLVLTTINGNLDNRGLVRVQGFSDVNGALTTTAGSTLRVLGTSAQFVGQLTVANGFTNLGVIELVDSMTTCCGSGATLVVTSGTLVNASGASITTPQGTSPTQRVLNARVNNQGTISVNTAGGLALGISGAQHTNSGTITLSAGALTIPQSGPSPSFTNTGTIDVPAGRQWNVTSGALDLSSGTVTGGGTLATNGTTITLPSFPSTLYGLSLNLGNSTLVGSALTVPPGETVTFGAGTSFNAAVTNQGLLRILGTVNLNGTLTTTAASTIRVLMTNGNPATLTVPNLVNLGTIELSDSAANNCFCGGALLQVSTGQLTNAPGATIHVVAGGPPHTRGINAVLDNQGTLIIAATQGLQINRSGAQHTNSGTITIGSPTATSSLNVIGDYLQTGTIDLKVGGVSTFDQFTITGIASLGGTIRVATFNNFTPTTGQTFNVLTYTGAPVGDFTTRNLPGSCTGAPQSGQYQVTC